MAKIKLTPFEEVLDDFYGKIGTPDRDKFEAEVSETVHAWRVGEAMKKARLEQNLSQEQLGERIGVKNFLLPIIAFQKIILTFAPMNIMVKTIHTPMMLVAGVADRKRNAALRQGFHRLFLFTSFVFTARTLRVRATAVGTHHR